MMNHDNPPTAPEKGDDECDDEGAMETDDPETRWKGLSTVVGLLVALHYPVLVTLATFGAVDLSVIPEAFFWADTIGWMGVMTYIFGEDTIATARSAMGK